MLPKKMDREPRYRIMTIDDQQPRVSFLHCKELRALTN